MSLQDRIDSLRSKHTAIDQALQAELQSPANRPEDIARLKREKLRLKDEISRLETPAFAAPMNGSTYHAAPGA